ncbi:hypothetical protein [Sulfitobacter aestuariivivens]|uniref:hypothetical protein n=1 Tax=Sulfitobacter aestuariivivens TaxID=2766981 RepID=UPI00361E8BCE
MTTYTGTIFNNLYDFPGLSIVPGTIDGNLGRDTIDGTGLNLNYLFDFENNLLSLTDGTRPHTFLSFEEAIGGNGNDIMIGGSGTAPYNLNGGNGDDTVGPGSAGILNGDEFHGGSGTDALDFLNLSTNFVVDLNTGEFSTGSFMATVSGIEEVRAGSGDDFLRDAVGVNATLHGGLGDDTLATTTSFTGSEHYDGGTGTDLFDFTLFTDDYTANLLTGEFFRADSISIMSLESIEQVTAGTGNDRLYAGDVASASYSMMGNLGNDTIYARADGLINGDTYAGGGGSDRLDFGSFTANVRFNMLTGTFLFGNGTGGGSATGIEDARAGSGNDIIGGTANDDRMSGRAGNDTLVGNEGNDSSLAEMTGTSCAAAMATIPFRKQRQRFCHGSGWQ